MVGGSRALKGFLDVVEWAGNKLPHPFMIFVYLAGLVILSSWVLSLFGVSVVDPGTNEEVPVMNMLSGDGLQYILTSMVDNFAEFPPLALILILMLGIGLAQKVGLLETAMQKAISGAPSSMVTYVVIFAGVLANLASNAAYVIVPPLAALVFLNLGRHPIAGLAAGFAAAGGGFTANLFVSGTDVLLSGISTEVARSVDETLTVTPVANWFFMIASVLMIMLVGTFVTERIVEPRLGEYEGDAEYRSPEEITERENRGLRNALIVSGVLIAGVFAALLPSGSPLRGEDGSIVQSPFLDGIVPILLFYFVAVAVTYGVTAGTITTTADVPNFMGEAIRDYAGLIVLFFAAAQFIAYFDYSNIATWISVNGAELLESINLTGVYALVGLSLVTLGLGLFTSSGSALWALMAPTFIPLFLILDVNPAYVQLAFRLGESSNNIITPLNPFVPMLVAFMKEYDEEAGFGTVFSLMLPYTILFFVCWIAMFLVWSALGLPIGPGEYIQLD